MPSAGRPFRIAHLSDLHCGGPYFEANLLERVDVNLRGVFLAIATLGFAEAVRIGLLNQEWTGGAQGLAVPRILTVDEVIEQLEAVTIDDLLRVARRFLAPSEARLAVLGPFRSRSRFERALRA